MHTRFEPPQDNGIDTLTGLVNRQRVHQLLEKQLQLLRLTPASGLAVLLIDLDAFSPINDALGHNIGDQLLINIGQRLQALLQPNDILARLGDDEFVVVLVDGYRPDTARYSAERFLKSLSEVHRVAGFELYLSASIGVALFHKGLNSGEQLLQQADMAMQQAKRQGKNTFCLYNETMQRNLNDRFTIRNDFQEAIEKQQLRLNFQPIFDQYGQIITVEILTRWHHPTLGVISPSVFIPIAEESGQIIPVSQWIIHSACQIMRLLKKTYRYQGRLAINISPVHFHRAHFLADMTSAVMDAGIFPADIELEITESILLQDSEATLNTLRALESAGFRTVIDDFGAGFSSLKYIKSLPIQHIKIDKYFISDLITNTKAQVICQGVITLAQALNLTVTAEGIEHRSQYNLLKSMGCDFFQGYNLSCPLTLDELRNYLLTDGVSVPAEQPSTTRRLSAQSRALHNSGADN